MTDIKKNAFSLFLLRLFLSTLGIDQENQPFGYKNHVSLFITVAFFNDVQLLVLFFTTQDPEIFSVVGLNIIHALIYHTTWIVMHINGGTFQFILKAVQTGIYEYPVTMQEYQPKHKSKRIILVIFFFVVEGSYFIILFIPMIYYTLFSNKLPTIKNLMYPTWYPWQVNTLTSYYLTYLHQVLTAFIHTGFYPLNIVFLMYFMLAVHDQNTTLHRVMLNVITQSHKQNSKGQPYKSNSQPQTITKNDKFKYSKFQIKVKTSATDEQLYDDLIQCMKHHHQLIKFIKYFVDCYKWVFACNLLYSIIAFAFSSYLLIIEEFYWPKSIQRILTFMILIPHFFSYCYIGEIFMKVNQTFRKTLYESNWYDKSSKVQKLILLLLVQVPKDMNLKFSANIVASYGLFANVMRASYTYTNVLLKIYK